MATSLDMGKQVGPLPLGAWVVVVGGGLAIAYWQYSQGSGSDEPEIVEDTGSPEGVGEGPGWTYVPPNVDDSDSVEYESNEQWGVAAVNWLTAQGYNAATSNNAITKALAGGVDIDGNKMSIQEWSLWSLALVQFGSPPYPVSVSPPTSVPGPTNPPKPPPNNKPGSPKPIVIPRPDPEKPGRTPHHYRYITVPGDTPLSIARKTNKQYNLKNTWIDIYRFNQKWREDPVRTSDAFRGGGIWWIPKKRQR